MMHKLAGQGIGIWPVVVILLLILAMWGLTRKKKPNHEPPNAALNRWKTILVILCALFLGLMLGLTMRHAL